MKILVLAIVLCVASSQGQGNYRRRSHPTYKRQEAYKSVTGEEMMTFVIETLESLQSLFAAHQWDDLYQYPDISLRLPSIHQNPRRSEEWWAREQIENQDLDPMGWSPFAEPGEHQAQWSRRRDPPRQSGNPPGRPSVPPPPPPRPTSPPPERRNWPKY